MATPVDATELTEQKPQISHERPHSEYNPCDNAKITSPFYLYKHESPRSSFDVRKMQEPVKIAVHDLESGVSLNNLSPSVTQEKKDAQKAATKHRLMFWKKQKQCMMEPKQRGCVWMSRLSPRQRILVKVLIGLLIVGAAVAIAVSVSIRVGGGVYKDSNTTTQIG
jgi:hypothetical protein